MVTKHQLHSPNYYPEEESNEFQPRTKLDTGIIPPNDETISNYSELLSSSDIGGFNANTTLNSSANFDNAFRIL